MTREDWEAHGLDRAVRDLCDLLELPLMLVAAAALVDGRAVCS